MYPATRNISHLNLAVAPVVGGHGARRVPRVLVGVDLHVHRETLDALLRAEVRAQALHGDVDLEQFTLSQLI